MKKQNTSEKYFQERSMAASLLKHFSGIFLKLEHHLLLSRTLPQSFPLTNVTDTSSLQMEPPNPDRKGIWLDIQFSFSEQAVV